MRVQFVLPERRLRLGGINAAIDLLKEQLSKVGIQIGEGVDLSKPNIVHHFHGLWSPINGYHARTLRALRRSYIFSPHGMLEPWAFKDKGVKKRLYYELVEKSSLHNAHTVLATSEMERRRLIEDFQLQSVRTLPFGVSEREGIGRNLARSRLGWKPEERRLLYLSRLDRKKGLDLLLSACRQILPEAADWIVTIVGDGDARFSQEVRAFVDRELSGKMRIEWKGAVWGPEKWLYLEGADVLCLPSHSENFGLVVLEALQVGTPVLTTTQTPWADYSDVRGIIICEPTLPSLTHALQIVAGTEWTENDRVRLSVWARSRFSWSRIAEGYRSIYEQAAVASK